MIPIPNLWSQRIKLRNETLPGGRRLFSALLWDMVEWYAQSCFSERAWCAFYFYFWGKECIVLRERNVLKEVVVVARELGTWVGTLTRSIDRSLLQREGRPRSGGKYALWKEAATGRFDSSSAGMGEWENQRLAFALYVHTCRFHGRHSRILHCSFLGFCQERCGSRRSLVATLLPPERLVVRPKL